MSRKLLYTFSLTVDPIYSLSEILQHAREAAEEQQGFELNCGGSAWPSFTVEILPISGTKYTYEVNVWEAGAYEE